MIRQTHKRIERHIAALDSADTKVAGRAEANLIRYYGSRALEPLMAACDHSNPGVGFRAAWALAHTGEPRAFETLLRLTHDPVGEVRYDAAVALGILGDERAIAPLIALMSTPDPDTAVDSAAALGLQKLGQPAVPALLPLLQNTTPPVRNMTAHVLGCIGDEAAIEPLADLLTAAETETRIAGIESLAAIGTPHCLALIETCLQDTSEPIRQNAAYWSQELRQTLA